MNGLVRRVCLFGGGIVACLALASCGDGPKSPSNDALAAKSAVNFLQHSVGLPNNRYPSFWTNGAIRQPYGAPVRTAAVVVQGNCAAVVFDSPSGPKTAFIRLQVRHRNGKWVPEGLIAGANQAKNLDSTAQNCF